MSHTWGEAAWTAPDLAPAQDYIVTDPVGTIHGRFSDPSEADALREEINMSGQDAWVVPVDVEVIE